MTDNPNSVRECVRVTPTTEAPSSEAVSKHLGGIHSLSPERDDEKGVLGRLASSVVPDGYVRIECLVISEGEDEPVEVYYTADEQLSALERGLKNLYPSSFEFERTTIDLRQKLIRPVELDPDGFVQHLEAGTLRASVTDLKASDQVADERKDVADDQSSSTSVEPDPDEPVSQSSDDEAALPVTREAVSPSLPVPQKNGTLDPQSGYGLVDDTIIQIGTAESIPTEEPLTALEQPAAISNDRILARPAVSEVEPYAVRWKGKEERSGDWMTAAKTSTAVPDEYNSWRANQQDNFEPEPLVTVMERAVEASAPTAFQVVAEPKPNWEGEADRRIENLNDGRDQTFRKVLGTERGHALESEQERIQLIKAKHSKRSFEVNVRLLSIHTPYSIGSEDLPNATTVRTDSDAISRFHDDMETLLNPIDGEFYWFVGKRANRSSGRLSNKSEAELVWQRFQERDLVTRADEGMAKSMNPMARTHPELILSPPTLADLMILPSAHQFSGDLFRSTGAHHQDRSPLPAPNPHAIQQFQEGATVGYPITEDGDSRSEPVALPKRLLRQHFGVFAGSGAGKSIKIANLLLSLHEEIPGPEILFEPKGDQMCENYLRSYYGRYGDLEDVYFFNVPEQLPSVAFFDIRPALSAGRDRSEAVQDRINHFHSIMEVIMGEDQYNAAYLATQIISYLIRTEFDEEYGSDVFTVDDLYQAAEQLYRDQSVPRASQDVEDTLSRLLEKPERDFDQTMSAVFTRLDKLRENEHIYEMLNQNPEWDSHRERYADECLSFRELANRDVQLLFDTGALRPETQQAFTLVLLSTLWDDMQWRRRQDDDANESQVNLIIEEAAGIASKPLVYEQLIPQARSFELSLGFVMQFPSQVRDVGGERAYNEIMNNVQNKIYGKIQHPDAYLESSIAVDEVVPEQIANKLKHMRPGEWVVDFSARFGDEVTTPFSIEALPIPDGHPEGDSPLEETPKFERAYRRCIGQTVSSFTTGADELDEILSTPSSDTQSVSSTPSGTERTLTSKRSPATTEGAEPANRSAQDTEALLIDNSVKDEEETADTGKSAGPASCDECGNYIPQGVDLCENCRKTDTEEDNGTGSTDGPDQSDSLTDAGMEEAMLEEQPAASSGGTHVEDVPMDGDEVDVDAASIETMADVKRVARAVYQHHSGFTEGVKYGVIEQHANIADIDTCKREIRELAEDAAASTEDDDASDSPTSTANEKEEGTENASAADIQEADQGSIQSGQSESAIDPEHGVQDGLQQFDVPIDGDRVNVEAAPLRSEADIKRIANAIHASPTDQSETTHSLRHLHSRAVGAGIDVSFADLQDLSTDPNEESTRPETAEVDSTADHVDSGADSDLPSCDNESVQDDVDGETVFDQIPETHASVRPSRLEQMGLTRDDADLLGLVAKAYHRELDDYSLLESMTSLRDRAGDPNVDRLKELDLIERASSRRVYYSLLPDGWDLINRTQHTVGDWREKTPHRVGVAITEELLAQRDDIDRVETYHQWEGDSVFDVVGFDSTDSLTWVAEVECLSGNCEAVRDDYEKLAEVDASTLWVVQSQETLEHVLSSLRSGDITPENLRWKSIANLSALQDRLDKAELDGMDELRTFSSARSEIDR